MKRSQVDCATLSVGQLVNREKRDGQKRPLRARSARRWAIPAALAARRQRPPRQRARPTSWSCCSTMSASPISAATARRSRRRPSTRSPRRGLRYTGFHTTAMCSTTRAALLTGRNHHSVGVGCLANFDSGYPGYRGKIAREAGTLAEMLRPHGYRNYMLGKWHVTPLTEIGADRTVRRLAARPRLRPLLRLHGCRDRPVRAGAGARQHAIDPPGTFATGYHLTADLVDQSIRFIADHVADAPQAPWLIWLALRRLPRAAPGAARPDPQVRRAVRRTAGTPSASAASRGRRRWASCRRTRACRRATTACSRGPSCPTSEQRLFTRLQAAYAAMLDHADQHLARLVGFLEQAGQLDDTLVLVMSDNGASQEGGPLGMVNAMGPYNLRPRADRRRSSRASTTSAGPTRIPTSRSAGRWRPTRR